MPSGTLRRTLLMGMSRILTRGRMKLNTRELEEMMCKLPPALGMASATRGSMGVWSTFWV